MHSFRHSPEGGDGFVVAITHGSTLYYCVFNVVFFIFRLLGLAICVFMAPRSTITSLRFILTILFFL